MKMTRTQWMSMLLVIAMAGVALAEGGSISGVINYNKNEKQPARKPLQMGTDPYCVKHWGGQQALNERWIFGKDDTLVNVFVWVSKGLEGKKFDVPAEAVQIDQVGCMYIPHITGVMVGQELKVRNSDATLHNVHIIPDTATTGNPEKNIGQPGKGIVETIKFKNAEAGIYIKCDVHAWMNCYVHAVPHPFFAVSDDAGKFTIKGLPPGEYELSTWHEFKLFAPDKDVIKVTVTEGGDAKVEVTYAPKKRD
ncbi:MAG: hypothetical protein WD768_16400 [Phycisphaeraceae bacterium]